MGWQVDQLQSPRRWMADWNWIVASSLALSFFERPSSPRASCSSQIPALGVYCQSLDDCTRRTAHE